VYKDLRLGWDLLKGGTLSCNWHHGRTCLIWVSTLLKWWIERHLRSSSTDVGRNLRHHTWLLREVPEPRTSNLVGELPSLLESTTILIATIPLVVTIVTTTPLSLNAVVVLIPAVSVTTRR
jgi:hypothetical protein